MDENFIRESYQHEPVSRLLFFFFCFLTNHPIIFFLFFLFYLQDESEDYIKRQQLRELAMLNSNFKEESPGPSGSVSPFNTSGMKRAKTGR